MRYPVLQQSLKVIRRIAPTAVSQVVDIGVQRRTDFLMDAFPDKHHHLFEPVNTYHPELERNYRERGIHHTLHKIALSDTNGQLYLHNTSRDGSGRVTHSDIKPQRQPDTKFLISIEEVETRRLDEVLSRESLGDLSYLVKLDVDGVEEKIVAGGVDVVGGASFVVIEASIGRRDLCSRAAMLEKLGFRMFDICDNAYYFGQLALVDLVMINDRLRSSEIKFRPWEYAGGRVVWTKWQHGFRSLVAEPVEDPFEEGSAQVAQVRALQDEFTGLVRTQATTHDPARRRAWATNDTTLARAPESDPLSSAGPVLLLDYRRDEAPHRELRFIARGLRSGSELLPEFKIKLVDHHGRPGLAVFESADRPTLAQWSPSGSEEGRDFMLLVPADAGARSRLLSFGTHDWRLVLTLAAWLDQVIATHSSLGANWAVTSARLTGQLAGLPPRLRYDEREATDDGSSGTVTLRGASWGLRTLPDLRLQWSTSGAATEFVCEIMADHQTPPLACWPVNPDGTLASRWSIPVCRGLDPRDGARWWSTLAENERDLAIGLFDVLPAKARKLRRRAHRSMVLARLATWLRSRRRGALT